MARHRHDTDSPRRPQARSWRAATDWLSPAHAGAPPAPPPLLGRGLCTPRAAACRQQRAAGGMPALLRAQLTPPRMRAQPVIDSLPPPGVCMRQLNPRARLPVFVQAGPLPPPADTGQFERMQNAPAVQLQAGVAPHARTQFRRGVWRATRAYTNFPAFHRSKQRQHCAFARSGVLAL